MSGIRRLIVERYLDIASLLNTIEDDQEREVVQDAGETALNDELYHGSISRTAVAPLYQALQKLHVVEPDPVPVTELHSWRVGRREGDAA